MSEPLEIEVTFAEPRLIIDPAAFDLVCRLRAEMQQERDEHRRLIIRLFRKLDMTEQLYGEGPEIVAANPWMLQEGPWQSPAGEP